MTSGEARGGVTRSQARAPDPLAAPPGIVDLLRKLGLYHPLRYLVRRVRGVENYLRAKGVIVRPLVPEEELFDCQRAAIRTLLARDPAHHWGDYLEFGVFQGRSLSLMYRALGEAGLHDKVRLFGFDSFEGYPQGALDEPNNYMPGGDKAEAHVARRVLTKRGVDWRCVMLIKGWFSESLTPELKMRESIDRVSLVNFDCDLYLSTAQALAFVGPLVHDTAIFFMDDWGTEEMINQKKAFVEFLEANPTIYAEELPNYSWESRVFLISRGAAGQPWQERLRMMGGAPHR